MWRLIERTRPVRRSRAVRRRGPRSLERVHVTRHGLDRQAGLAGSDRHRNAVEYRVADETQLLWWDFPRTGDELEDLSSVWTASTRFLDRWNEAGKVLRSHRLFQIASTQPTHDVEHVQEQLTAIDPRRRNSLPPRIAVHATVATSASRSGSCGAPTRRATRTSPGIRAWSTVRAAISSELARDTRARSTASASPGSLPLPVRARTSSRERAPPSVGSTAQRSSAS